MTEATALSFDDVGLVTAVVQHCETGAVLMVAHMDEAAWNATRTSGLATFYSRSRARQWVKGESSGNFMRVREIWVDCDRDSVLLKVDPDGPACHTGSPSCFFEQSL